MANPVFTVTMTSGATLSAEINLQQAWKRVWIDPTSMKSEVRFKISNVSGGTYRQVYLPQAGAVATTTVGSNIWKVASAISGGVIDAPPGFQFMKIETTATVDDGGTCKIYCSDI